MCKDNTGCKPQHNFMNEIQITKEKMENIKALAEINLQISEAKNALVKLKNSENDYIKEREAVVLKEITDLYEKSKEIISNISKNSEEIDIYIKTITQTTNFLSEIHEDFQKMLKDFLETKEEWDKEYKKQSKALEETGKYQEAQLKFLYNERKNNENTLKTIEKEKEIIRSKQAQIKSALEVIKNKK
jgi:chromosome segregation ATPase